jgi:hypothetical protein
MGLRRLTPITGSLASTPAVDCAIACGVDPEHFSRATSPEKIADQGLGKETSRG